MQKRSRVQPGDIVVTTDQGLIVEDPQLTPTERAWVEMIVVHGPSVLIDRLGWTEARQSNFLARPNVMLAIDRAKAAMADAEQESARAQISARRQLLPLLPQAILLIRQAMNGVQNGTLPPTKDQLDAAYKTLSLCGVGPETIGNLNITQINVSRPANAAAYDRAEVVRRDRVRRAVEALIDIQSRTDRKINRLLKRQDKYNGYRRRGGRRKGDDGE